MGKLGTVRLALDKPYYLAGDTVSGTVYLEALDELPVDKVYVKIKGKEKVEWQEHWESPVYEEVEGQREVVGQEEHEEEYDEKESFFKKKIQLGAEDMVLQPGRYAFPFQFELPEQGAKGGSLPGQFCLKEKKSHGWSGARGETKELKVKVEYSAKVVVDIDDSKDLETKMDIAVYAERPEEIATPSDERTAAVMFCCCINRGTLTMRASLDSNVYAPGQTAYATLHVENNSAMEVTAMAEINRQLVLRADSHTIVKRHEQNLGRFDVVGPGETKEVQMKFQIPDAMPSTDGRGVKCSYVLDIVSEISFAPDIELHFPVHIYQPPIPPKQWLEGLGDISGFQVLEACEVSDMPLKPGYAPNA